MESSPNNPPGKSMEPLNLPINAVCISDAGQVRENNEDNYRLGLQDGIFIVADGMGGHQSGEVASRTVIELLPEILKNLVNESNDTPVRYKSILSNSIKKLNQLVYRKAKKEAGLHGMGSTVALVWLPDSRGTVYLANVGDSRIYFYHQHTLNQVSVDHSIVGLLVMQGEIKPEDAWEHPSRGQLYRYIGMDGDAVAEIHNMPFRKDDILLLCSDGITDDLSDFRIQSILSDSPDIETACQELIDAANRQGGRDNITAMLLQWTGE